MKKLSVYILFVSLGSFFIACEDVVDVDLAEGTSQLNVDAWLDNRPQTQEIRLTQSKTYFDDGNPEPVLDANVVVTDSEGTEYVFEDADRDGRYTWQSIDGTAFGKIGLDYFLSIETGEESYVASSSMNRVPPIDSITYEFEEEGLGTPEGYYAEFFSRDFSGPGDTYWIKTYKNGIFLNKPGEINIAFDAGFSAGGNVDGLIFIPPIRFAINRVPDSGDDAEDDNQVPPYDIGDDIRVEIYSIPLDAFTFLEQARNQLTNEGLFATPLANVPTNIFNAAGEVPVERQAVGYFTVSAVSSLETTVMP
ncbi:MAG: DUF4249 domain-containing protein [Bacteroidota bacterium]